MLLVEIVAGGIIVSFVVMFLGMALLCLFAMFDKG